MTNTKKLHDPKSEGKHDYDTVSRKLHEWNARKNRLFGTEKFVKEALAKLESAQLIGTADSTPQATS